MNRHSDFLLEFLHLRLIFHFGSYQFDQNFLKIGFPSDFHQLVIPEARSSTFNALVEIQHRGLGCHILVQTGFWILHVGLRLDCRWKFSHRLLLFVRAVLVLLVFLPQVLDSIKNL